MVIHSIRSASRPCTSCDRSVEDRYTLCPACGTGIVRALCSVPSLLVDLTVARARLDRLQIAREGGRSAQTPMPVRAAEGGTEMLGDRDFRVLADIIDTWARMLTDRVGMPVPLGAPGLVQMVHNNRGESHRDPSALSMTPAGPLEQTAVWLSCYEDELRSHPAADRLLMDLTAVLDRLRVAVDRPMEGRYVGPCPALLADGSSCGYELRADRETRWVRCRRCRAWHELDQLEARARAAAEDQLWPLADILRVLARIGAPVSRSTLYRWARKGRIEVRGWQHNGRFTDHRIMPDDVPVYRLGDVLHLVTRTGEIAG